MEADDHQRAVRERALLQAVLNGDECAWRTWYDATFSELYRYILWRCGGLADQAEEVTQETWLTAVQLLHRFDPMQGSFLGWLRGIAANRLRNRFRQSSRRAILRLGLSTDQIDLQSPSQGMESREQQEEVARALGALPAHYEEVLRARYLDGLGVAEIARARGMTSKAVESLLTRARDAFRAVYRHGRETP
jgi:RNA polymerase sigma-70 factor (ECF subfamily)